MQKVSVRTRNEVAEAGALDESGVNAILEAVARRLAANKYDLLQEMVRQGMLRLVVEDGVIETRLIFNTYGSTFYQEKSSDYQRSSFSFRSKARTGAFVSLWAKALASRRPTIGCGSAPPTKRIKIVLAAVSRFMDSCASTSALTICP